MHGGRTAPLRRCGWLLIPLVLGTASAAESEFPFDQELLLDAAPMPGSKRVPTLEVHSDGAAAIDLWCASGRGQVHIDGATISIVPYGMKQGACAPERMQRDAQMLAALNRITSWRREGDVVVLIGPQELRYRLSTN